MRFFLFFLFFFIFNKNGFSQEELRLTLGDLKKIGENISEVQLYLDQEISFLHTHTDTIRRVKKGKFFEHLEQVQKKIIIRADERGVVESFDQGSNTLIVRFDDKEKEMKLPFRPNGTMANNIFVFCAVCMTDTDKIAGIAVPAANQQKKIEIEGLDYVLPSQKNIFLTFEAVKTAQTKVKEKKSKGANPK